MPDADVISVHEAGHVFMAVALGYPVRSVQLDPPRFDLVDELGPDARRDHIRILMAGCAGELLLGSAPRGGGSDDPEIARLLQGDDEAALRREVKLFIAANYPAVLRIARALRRDDFLTGDEVEALVRGPPGT